MDQAEEALASALVAVVSGTRSTMTASQVVQLLGQHYSMGTSDVQVKRYSRGDFLLVFSSRQLANQILHMPPGAAFHLVFQRWWRQARALSNPSSARFFDVMQGILGSSCLIFDSSPRLLSSEDLSCFLLRHDAATRPSSPLRSGFSFQSWGALFREGEPPLFLRASEIIHSSCDLLHYQAIINVLKYHDFSTLPSSDHGSADGSDRSSNDEEYSGYDAGQWFLNSWLATHQFVSGSNPAGVPWPSL
jgi:hypothetical protein